MAGRSMSRPRNASSNVASGSFAVSGDFCGLFAIEGRRLVVTPDRGHYGPNHLNVPPLPPLRGAISGPRGPQVWLRSDCPIHPIGLATQRKRVANVFLIIVN